MANQIHWAESTWKDINDAVLVEMGKVRTAQKIFPTAHLDSDPSQITDELINFDNLTIQEGQTKPFVELSREFTLTSTQVKQEAAQNTGKTLARMAAKSLALAEDAYFFQVSQDGPRVLPGNPLLPAGTQIENWRIAVDLGLLRAASPPDADSGNSARVVAPLVVDRAQRNANNAQWGNNTFARVAEAITLLTGKAQAGPYAIVLPTEAYADTFIPPSPDSLVTTADSIRPLVSGGFYTSPVLPRYEGLIVALAGDPVNLFVGREAASEFVVQLGANFVFRVVERVQYVVRDPRALVLLKFTPPQGAAPVNAAQDKAED